MKSFIALLTIILSASYAEALVAQVPDDYGTDSNLYCPQLTQTLKRSMRDATTGGQVSELQTFLSDYFNLDEEEYVTGFFGRSTHRYLVEFQQKNNLPAFGIAGVLTRAKIAEVCKGNIVTPLKKCVVGGCSGQLCIEDGSGGISTCEYREEYACYKKASCGRQADGQCGWTMTPELKQCLNPTPKPCERPAPPSGCYWKDKPWGTRCEGELVCAKPAFRAEPSSGNGPLTVTFSVNAGDEESYSIDFGDGSTGTMSVTQNGSWRSAVHVYQNPGAYTAVLTKAYRCRASGDVSCAALDSQEVGRVTIKVLGSSPVTLKTGTISAGSNGLIYVSQRAYGLNEAYVSNPRIDWGDGTIEKIACEQLSYPTSYIPSATQVAAAMYIPQRCDHGYMSVFTHNYSAQSSDAVTSVKEYTIRIIGDYGEVAKNTIRIWAGMQPVTGY